MSQLITIIGRGHGGTRAASHTLTASGVYMGEPLNVSGDLIPANDLYEACRVMAKYVTWNGGLNWDFSKLHDMPIDPAFTRLVESYLSSVLSSDAERKGWKLPETTLIYPWIVRMFPDIDYIHWVRDPRDAILSKHLTDDLHDFGIDYEPTDDVRQRRAISWKYQVEIIKATPAPNRTCQIRFEDFVLKQDQTLNTMSEYLGFPLEKIEVRPESVGRYKTAEGEYDFDVFQEDLKRLSYK